MTANLAPGDDPDVPLPWQGGAPGALDPEATFRQALPDILAMARRRGFREDEQHDIAQKVGVILVTRRENYDPAQGLPVEWAIGIAKNLFRQARCADRARRGLFEQMPLAGLDNHPSGDLTPEERARAYGALEIVRAALTEQQQEILELTVEGCTAKEVAAILGIPVTTVELRLRQARIRLAAALKRLGEDENSVTKVRGAALPFVLVEDIEHAWRKHLLTGTPLPLPVRQDKPG